jgi:hypothetical protein
MLHELLFALLGFVGSIIVEVDDCYKVKDGYDLLNEAERDQINRVAPLGWYYVQLGALVKKYDISWGKISLNGTAVYRSAAMQGVSDLLQEYVADVSYLDKLILSDGPIPVSQVLQHLQKVSFSFYTHCVFTLLRFKFENWYRSL